MATTYLKPYRMTKGSTVSDTMQDRFAYGLNPEKCAVASSHLCDPVTAHLEFLLVKTQYQAITGRPAEKGNLFFQIRQAFPQGEVTPEQANAIGYETAIRWTKGKYQFIVCTHTDKGHLHNHIYYNSTAYDRSRKFHNFLGSTFAVRRLSDRVCLEHGLSVIENPRQHSKGDYKHYGEWLGEDAPLTFQQRLTTAIDAVLSEQPKDIAAFIAAMEAAGFEHKYTRGALSFRCPVHGQDRFTRLRASTLGDGYGLEDILAVIEGRSSLQGRAVHSPSSGVARADTGARPAGGGSPSDRSPRPVNLIIDIQSKLRDGKGPAYERWAKIYNLKMMAAALQYLQENKLLAYADLAAKADGAVDRFHDLAGEIQTVETAMTRNSELKAAMIDYAKTRPAFDGYKAAKYSRAYLAAHEADIATHRAARATFSRLLDGGKLPKMDVLKAEWQRLTADKKALYAKYRAAQKDMREVVAVKANVDHLLGITGGQRNKEAERS